jgi:hypothetical protein
MGVYIKGMVMPENCSECPVALSGKYCRINKTYTTYIKLPIRPDYCPLVKVPEPHGDLVDRNILEQELINGIKAGNFEEGYEHYANINNMDDCVECVRYADTVIEAEDE